MPTAFSPLHRRTHRTFLFSLGVILASLTLPFAAQASTSTKALKAPLVAYAKAEVAGSSKACKYLTPAQRKQATKLAKFVTQGGSTTCGGYFAFTGKALKTQHAEDGTSYHQFASKFVKSVSKAKIKFKGSRATATFSTSADGCRDTDTLKLKKFPGAGAYPMLEVTPKKFVRLSPPKLPPNKQGLYVKYSLTICKLFMTASLAPVSYQPLQVAYRLSLPPNFSVAAKPPPVKPQSKIQRLPGARQQRTVARTIKKQLFNH